MTNLSEFSKTETAGPVSGTAEGGFVEEFFLESFLKKSFRLWAWDDGFFSTVVRKAVSLQSALVGLKLLLKFLKGPDTAADGATPGGLLTTLLPLVGLKLSLAVEEKPFNSRDGLRTHRLPTDTFVISNFVETPREV
jgi:hypothetical protein